MNIAKSQLTSPCVYRVFGKGSEVLYIGCGVSGMGRVFDVTKEQNGRTTAFRDCSEVSIEFHETREQASAVEAELIHSLHPKYNAFCYKCNHYIKSSPRRLQGKGLVFGKTKHALLELLLDNPEKGYLIREISRLINISVGSVQRELKVLAKRGILRCTQHGKYKAYSAETACPFYQELRSMVLKGA